MPETSYCTLGKTLNSLKKKLKCEEDHRSYDTTFAVAKRKPEKIQVCMGFEPLSSAIPVQRS